MISGQLLHGCEIDDSLDSGMQTELEDAARRDRDLRAGRRHPDGLPARGSRGGIAAAVALHLEPAELAAVHRHIDRCTEGTSLHPIKKPIPGSAP